MRRKFGAAVLSLVLGAGAAQAEPGGFFKNLFSGDGKDSDRPESSGPRVYDPSDPYCPAVNILEGNAALQSYAGAAGDNTRLRHQLIFGRLGRECALRDDGSIGVKVGLEVRALLGPAGAPGRFDAPVTVSTRCNGVVLSTHSRRLSVTIPPGAASGTVSTVEPDLVVPADKAVGYAITVSLGAAPARTAPQAARQRRKPAATEVTAGPAE